MSSFVSSRRFLACALTLLSLAPAFAAERTRVVVTPIEGSSEPLRALGRSVAEQILTELGRNEHLEAMGASDVQLVLGMERQKQLLGCADSSSCLAEISAAMGAPWLVTGSLAQSGKTTRLDLKLIRAADGKAMFRDGTNVKDDSVLFEVVTEIVKRMEARMELEMSRGPVQPSTAVTGTAAQARPAPIALIIAGGALAVGGGVLLGVEAAQRGNLDLSSLTYSDAKARLGTASTLMLVGAIAAGVGIIVAGSGLGWALSAGPAPQTAQVLVGPGGVSVRGTF